MGKRVSVVHRSAGPAQESAGSASADFFDLPHSPGAVRNGIRRRLDAKLVLGVVMVLVSMVVGARVVGGADQASAYWTVRSGLAAGTTLTADDLVPVRVDIGDSSGQYVGVSEPVRGQVVNRPLAAGELIPAAAVGPPASGRLVSVVAESGHVPSDLARGQRVDVYATYGGTGATPRTERIIAGAVVQGVERDAGPLSGGSVAVSVLVEPSDVGTVIAAAQTAELDVVRFVERST